MELNTSISKQVLETVHAYIQADSYLAVFPAEKGGLMHVLVLRPDGSWNHVDVQLEHGYSDDRSSTSLLENGEFVKIVFATLFSRTDVNHITEILVGIDGSSNTAAAISAVRLDSDPLFSSQEVTLLKAIAEGFSRSISLLSGNNLADEHGLIADYDKLFEDYSINSSPPMLNVYELFQKAKTSTANILIQGESGTGKQWMAQAIHRRGPYCLEPFTAISCDSMSRDDIERLIRALGKSENQDDGSYVSRKARTLYLKEIQALPPRLQALLCEILQHQQDVQPLSNSRDVLPARIIASSRVDIYSLVSKGAFREDLFYLINVIPIHLPPLRKRKDDLTGLIGCFLPLLGKRYNKKVSGIDGKCLTAMLKYRWPGNLLELEAVLARAIVLTHNPVLSIETLPEEIAHESHKRQKGEILKATGELSLAQIERKIVLEALQECRGNQSAAARLLKISRDNLRYRIKKYVIRKEEYLD